MVEALTRSMMDGYKETCGYNTTLFTFTEETINCYDDITDISYWRGVKLHRKLIFCNAITKASSILIWCFKMNGSVKVIGINK